jgi:hypothetical protein
LGCFVAAVLVLEMNELEGALVDFVGSVGLFVRFYLVVS